MAIDPVITEPPLAPPMPMQTVEGSAAWRGLDIKGSDDFTHRLTDAELAELDAAVQAIVRGGIDPLDGRLLLLLEQILEDELAPSAARGCPYRATDARQVADDALRWTSACKRTSPTSDTRQWATWRDARGRGLAADRSRQVLDHPLSCGA
jgi:hypothetical protein